MRSDRRALIIGIDEYKLLQKLDFPQNDAISLFEILQSYNCQFSCDLMGVEAKASTIREKFKALFSDADENATLLFYFAGHAQTIHGGTYLITCDAEEDVESGVYFQRLIDIVSNSRKPNQSCIFILDCCRAGALPIEQAKIDFTSLQNIVSSSLGITLLAATEEDKDAIEREDLQHGVFTYWLIEGLKGQAANQNGDVTISSLQEYLSDVMTKRSYKQRVVYKTTTVGASPVLAKGYSPNTHKALSLLSADQLREVEVTSRDSIIRLQDKSRVDYNLWITRGYMEVSNETSQLVSWRDELRSKRVVVKEQITG